MLSVGSRDDRKRLGLELEMEETDLEEGEALCYNDADENTAMDPDIALSYIEEKIQNVLGHFQKDFEGGVSAENLGAKFGGYGSFLPAYQRSPSWSHARSQQEVHNTDSPGKLHLQDHRKRSLAPSSAASPSARPCDASGRNSSVSNSLKGDVYLPSRHADEPILKRGVVMKSVNPSDQRTLKVRLKVCSENLSTQKNDDIYSGLGLVVSPSSSLDESPSTSERLCGKVLDAPCESPSNILEIMTSVPKDLLLSPLAEDLIHLTEKRKPKVKSESEIENKTPIEGPAMLSNGFHDNTSNQTAKEHKKLKSSEKYDTVSNKTSYQNNYDSRNNTVSLLKKEKEPEIDALGYEELVSNALKLPFLSSPQKSIDDPAKFMSTPTIVPVKEETFSEVREKKQLHNESLQESKKGNNINNVVPYAQQDVLKSQTDLLRQGVVQKRGQDSYDGLTPAPESSCNGGKRKTKRAHNKTAQYVHENQLVTDFSVTSKREKSSYSKGILSKTDSHDPHQKDHQKPEDRYKNFFGDIEFEEDDNESISGETTLKDTQQVGKRGLSERHSASSENRDVENSEKPRQPENFPRAAAPPLENGPNLEHPTATDHPLVNEGWVLCDKCGKWRLLPLGTNPKSLPDKWICRMLNWLPGMNRCSIPEDVTTTALRALYHSAPSVPAAVPSSMGVTSIDARNGEEHQNVTGQKTRKKKHGSTSRTYSTDVDGSTHSSNSRKKNLPSSGKVSSLNRVNPSVLDARGYQQMQQKNSDVDKHNDIKKDENVSLAAKGTNLKIRSQRESDLGGSRVSKRIKGHELREDENWASDNGESFSKAGRGYNSDLANNSSGREYTNHKDSGGDPNKNTVSIVDRAPGTSIDGLMRSGKSDDKKRKHKEYHDSQINAMPLSAMCENGHQKEKKARISKSLAANSSSSKVSSSHKNKTSREDVKGSPVESVSSSPSRLSNQNLDKVTSIRRNLVENYDTHDSGSLTVASSRKFSGSEDDEGYNRTGIVKENSVRAANDSGNDVYIDHLCESNQYASEKRSSDQNTQKPQSKKSGKRPFSHSKDKAQHTSESDINTDKTKASDLSCGALDHTPLSHEKPNSRRTKLDEKSGPPGKAANKFIVKKDATVQGTSNENCKGQKQKEPGNHHGQDLVKSQDKKHKLDKEVDAEKLPKKSNQAEVKKSLSLPPLARSQGENGIKVSVGDTLDNSDALKVPNQSKKAESQNCQPITSRQPTPNSNKVRDVVEAPSPLRRDLSSHAANTVIKEAKDLKHLADRRKNNGSTDSIGYYFQAVLKFLHGASLLESGSSDGTKKNDVVLAMHIYSSTAKLCEYCAHEYEKSKDMAAAALAYKCTEVAYMRVVYSSHTSAIRDRNELQTALQVAPPGESPSSSASDVDNLNHQVVTDKGPLAKVLGSPQVSGSHIISSQNRAGLLRLLNFAQEVNLAMEASRKSRIAYTVATSRLGEAPQREGIGSVKKALDFNFQDVEGLLRLVRVAMEAIGR